MLNLVCRVVFLFMTLVITNEVFANDYAVEPDLESYGEEDLAEMIPSMENDKVNRKLILILISLVYLLSLLIIK